MYMEHFNCFLHNTLRSHEVGLTIWKMLWTLYVINAAKIIYVEEPCNKAARSCLASLWKWKVHVFLPLPFCEVNNAIGAIVAVLGTGMSANPCHIFNSRAGICIKNGPETAL